MMRKEDLPKVFFIYLCLFHLAPGHPCGINPLRRFRPLSRMLGRDTNALLNLLRDSNPALYRQVQMEWRLYADCVGLVDTGYFKRSSGPGPKPEAKPGLDQDSRGQNAAMNSTKESRRAERLMALLSTVTGAQAGKVSSRSKSNLTPLDPALTGRE